MDVSEKRRERLRAMRTEASHAGASCGIGSEFHQLSNPLIESAVTPLLPISSPGTPRFDYYTDPMAAFSNDKRMNKGNYQNLPGSSNLFSTPRKPEMTSSPAHQVRPTYSPDPRMNQPPIPYYSSGPIRPQTTPSPAHHVQPTYSPDPRMYQQPRNSYYSYPAHHVQPPFSPNSRICQQPPGSYYNSGPRNHSTMSLSPFPPEGQSGHFQARAPYQSSHDNMRSPGFRGNSPTAGFGYGSSPNPGRGQSSHANMRDPSFRGNSPTAGSGFGRSPNPGRGRGRSGLGRGRNRGFCSHESLSAELRPDLYYNKSMVEDPWKDLEPSIWKNEVISEKGFSSTPDSRTCSHSNSLGTKKARISEASEESSSQPSLAAYLAAAFNETVGE